MLSKREAQVLTLLLQGLSNKQIAAELCICEKTVQKHLTSIYMKWAVCSRTEAVLAALKQSRGFPT